MGYISSFCFICSAPLHLDFCTLPACLEEYKQNFGTKYMNIVQEIKSQKWLNKIIGIDTYNIIHELKHAHESSFPILFEKKNDDGNFWELGCFSDNCLRKGKKLEDENKEKMGRKTSVGIVMHKKCFELLISSYDYSLKLTDMKDYVTGRDQFHFYLKYVSEDPFDRYYAEEFDYVRFVNDGLLWLLEEPTERNKNGKRIIKKWKEIIVRIKGKNIKHLYKKYKSKYLKLLRAKSP